MSEKAIRDALLMGRTITESNSMGEIVTMISWKAKFDEVESKSESKRVEETASV